MRMKTLHIDGSKGEGGGQILRSSLAMACLTGRPVTLRNIRAGRKKPGLLRQHLTCARAAAEICDGSLEGDEMRSPTLTFRPGKIKAGRYCFSIGTAGSAPLVLQTVLFPLLTASAPSTLILEGGTHNSKAPPFEFLDLALLPLIRRMGPGVQARLERPGFYPAGGGRFVVEIDPVPELRGFELHERGRPTGRIAVAKVADLPMHIAERQVKRLQKRLGWPDKQFAVESLEGSRSPGSILLVKLGFEHITEVLVGFGEFGLRAERIAEATAKEAQRYLKSPAPVGEYLADQLLLPLALAGHGGFSTRGLSPHARTQLEIIPKFLDVELQIDETEHRTVRVEVRS